MISLKQAKWLLIGGTVAFLWNRSRQTARRARSAQAEVDAEDAMAFADAEVAMDLASLDAELPPIDADIDVDRLSTESDSGELYGLHTPHAMNTDIPDQDRAMESGQTWLEALETSAAEDGADPEADLNIIDDEDMLEGTHASMAGDRPIADLGSAGPRGL